MKKTEKHMVKPRQNDSKPIVKQNHRKTIANEQPEKNK